MSYRFQLGQIITSPDVRALLTKGQLISVLRRHVSGEWHADCRAGNEQAVLNGSRIFSKFLFGGKQGQRLTLWIVTEEDRARTFVMFPRESVYRASDLEEVPHPSMHSDEAPEPFNRLFSPKVQW